MDSQNRKFTILSLLVFSGICGYVLYLALDLVAGIFRFADPDFFLGLSWTMVNAGLSSLGGIGLFLSLVLRNQVVEFLDDVFSEVKKTTWPNFQETASSTLVVLIMVLIAACLFLLMDFLWGNLFRILI